MMPSWGRDRVLARIFKMPDQNSNSKISARPDLATQLRQILIPTIFNKLIAYCVEKGNSHFSHVFEVGLL